MTVEIAGNDQPVRITCSIGVTGLENEDDTIDHLLARADRALYQAKHEGRNRLCAA